MNIGHQLRTLQVEPLQDPFEKDGPPAEPEVALPEPVSAQSKPVPEPAQA